MKRHVIIPDTQVKPGVSIKHLEWASRYIVDMAPDVVVHLGDHFDMESLSEYDKGQKCFEGRRYRKDIEAGNRGIEALTKHLHKLTNLRRVALLGNHEQRIERAIQKDSILDGTIGYDDFHWKQAGWEVQPFLKICPIDGIWYSHYFHPANSPRAYGGRAHSVLANVGHSFAMGHRPGREVATRTLADGSEQIGLIFGSFYTHNESFKGWQGNKAHWRGIVVLNEAERGGGDPMPVSLEYLRRKYA